MKVPASPDLPPLPREVHESPCRNCPSVGNIEEDLELQDLLQMPLHVRKEHVFRCAWRPQKLCRGYCDVMGIEET